MKLSLNKHKITALGNSRREARQAQTPKFVPLLVPELLQVNGSRSNLDIKVQPCDETAGARLPPAVSPPKNTGWDIRTRCAHAWMWSPPFLPAEGNYPSQRAALPLFLHTFKAHFPKKAWKLHSQVLNGYIHLCVWAAISM